MQNKLLAFRSLRNVENSYQKQLLARGTNAS